MELKIQHGLVNRCACFLFSEKLHRASARLFYQTIFCELFLESDFFLTRSCVNLLGPYEVVMIWRARAG